ncbi:hypothetical protein ACGCUP_01700 [Eubacteriales bacterium KG125]
MDRYRYETKPKILPVEAVAMLYAADIFVHKHSDSLDITDYHSKRLLHYSRSLIDSNSLLSTRESEAESIHTVDLVPTLVSGESDYALT